MINVSMPAELPSDFTEEDVRKLARRLGLTIPDENLNEVTYRITALLEELNKVRYTRLAGVDPLPIYPFEGGQTQ